MDEQAGRLIADGPYEGPSVEPPFGAAYSMLSKDLAPPWSLEPYVASRLFFTMGPARCGKSTYASRWAIGWEMPHVPVQRRVVWNSDDLRLVMGGRRYTRELEPQIHVTKIYAIRTLLLSGHIVLVDGTHTTPRSIHELLRIEADATPIPFDTPVAECIRRAHATGQADLEPVIERHASQLKVLLDEGVGPMMDRLRREVRLHDEYRWSKPCKP